MPEHNLFQIFVSRLNKSEIPYFVTGAVASIIYGEPIWLAPPEYVVLRKLEYYREGKSEKHLRDILSILEISSDQLDLEKLQKMVNNHTLEKEWEQILKMR